MIIQELQIRGFGKWSNADFRFAPGLNLVSAPNEAGKSTLLQAIIAALYGVKRDYLRSARYLPEYDKYLPWDGSPYETIIHYELGGKSYRLHRRLEKEREQAKLHLTPDWTDVTELYQEDRRKERNFLELHLGLTRTLFTDITWVKREPLAAAEYLLPSLSQAESTDPAANRVLAELERELAAVGKKERAEQTLLGKAASLAEQKRREWEAAEAEWQAVQQLSGQISAWESQRAEREKAASRLRLQLEELADREREWQQKWQNSFQLQHAEELNEWLARAATEEESRLHQRVRQELAECEEQLFLPIRGRRAGSRNRVSQRKGRGIRIGLPAASLLLALLAAAALTSGKTAAGWGAGALAVVTIGFAMWRNFLQQQAGHREMAQASEADVLREKRAQIVSRWGESLRLLLEQEKTVIEQEKQAMTARLAQCEQAIQQVREQIARASGELGRRDAASLAKAKSEYDDAAAAVQQWQKKREALLLAKETLQAAIAEWNRDISPSVNQLASEVMERITEGQYRDVRLDPARQFSVRLLEPAMQLVVEQEQCSTGTQDQLYFAQRIALLRHVSREKEPLPLFLDDHFVHYDEDRLKRTLDYVLELSSTHQVFLFSCQRRELEYLQPYLSGSERHRILHL